MAKTHKLSVFGLFWLFLYLTASRYVYAASVYIDCGSTTGSLDDNFKLWVGDEEFVSGGEIREITSSFRTVLNSLRFFRTQKSCYRIGVTSGQSLLIRASFDYGNYDGRDSPPIFDIYLEGSRWSTINPTKEEDKYTIAETVYTPQRSLLTVCLVRTRPNNFPFISALEVIDLESTMYRQVARNQALENLIRYDYGSSLQISGSGDDYDRIWLASPSDDTMTSVTSDTSIVLNTVVDKPPDVVMGTAVIPSDESQPLILNTFSAGTDVFYICLYFTEMSEPVTTQRRSFVVSVGGRTISSPIVPLYQTATELVLPNVTANENDKLALAATYGSKLPPIISAIEVYRVFDVIPSSNSRSGGGDGGDSDDENGGPSSSPCFDCESEPSSKKKNSLLPIIIGTAIPVGIIFWAVVGFCIIRSRRRRAAIANGVAGQGNPQSMQMGIKPAVMNIGTTNVNDLVQTNVNFDMESKSSRPEEANNGQHNNHV